jgi:hypothetical protein
MISPSLSTVIRIFKWTKSRWTRHVESDRRWELVESFSRSDKGRDRLGDIDGAVILKRIVMKWDITVRLRIHLIGFRNGPILTPLWTLNIWSTVLPEKINRLIPHLLYIRKINQHIHKTTPLLCVTFTFRNNSEKNIITLHIWIIFGWECTNRNTFMGKKREKDIDIYS